MNTTTRRITTALAAVITIGAAAGCASTASTSQPPAAPQQSTSAPAPAGTSTQYTDPDGYTCPPILEDASGLCPDNPAWITASTAPSSPADTAPVDTAPAAPAGPVSQQQALESAKSYLDIGGFSRLGLIGQLEYEKFSTADATWAVDHSGADWNAQAVKSAKSYMESVGGFSRGSLIDQLLYEKFTQAQAEYAAAQVGLSPAAPAGPVSQQQALESAKSYLDIGGFSRLGLIGQLEYEKFSTADATWAVDHSGADWNAQAVKSAKSYMESVGGFSRGSLIDQLLYEKFTQAQAEYAADQVGL